jgi:hypothetical protein
MIQEIKNTSNGKTTTTSSKIICRTFDTYKKLIKDDGQVLLRRNELLEVLNASIGIIDLSFNILISLEKKRINWQLLEDYFKDFGETFSLIGQTMPPLNLNFLKISSAIERHIPKETSKETRTILKIIYNYFDTLSLDEDIKENTPNFMSAKVMIISYYMLNDLLLGKVVGDIENKKEINQLENVLQTLANNTDFKVNIETFKVSLDKVISENDLENFIAESRGVFKEQLMQMNALHSWSVSKKQL